MNDPSKAGVNCGNFWLAISDKLGPKETTVTILGKEYSNKEEYEQEIRSKIWLTYRYGFEGIDRAEDGPHPANFIYSHLFNASLWLSTVHRMHLPEIMDGTRFTSDVGWGCMIRTSQSLLANALMKVAAQGRKEEDIEQDAISKGGDSQKQENGLESTSVDTPIDPEISSYEASHVIINQFQDHPGSTFSLHNFIRVASELPLQVKPGEWFGPNAASLSIKRLCDKMDFQPKIKVLLSESADLYDDKIARIFKNNADIKGILILLPVRLGIDKVNAYYNSSLKHLLAVPQAVGIAGGKPSSSFYFVGFQENNMIYVNPHVPQPISTPTDYSTYHSHVYQKLDIANLDPSMMIGVVVQDMNDYETFKASCIASTNKIVHFHTTEKKLSQRKNSEFVHVEHTDLPKSDFANIEDGDDDYVDLGVDFEPNNEPKLRDESFYEPEVLNLTESTATESTEEVLNITESNLETFETIPKLP